MKRNRSRALKGRQGPKAGRSPRPMTLVAIAVAALALLSLAFPGLFQRGSQPSPKDNDSTNAAGATVSHPSAGAGGTGSHIASGQPVLMSATPRLGDANKPPAGRATDLINQGTELFKEGKIQEAATHFLDAV